MSSLSRAIDIMEERGGGECVLYRETHAISDPLVRDGAGEWKISISRRGDKMNRDANESVVSRRR